MSSIGRCIDSFLNRIVLNEGESEQVKELMDRVNVVAKMAMMGLGFLAMMALVALSLKGVLVWGGMAYLAKEVISISANIRDLSPLHEAKNALGNVISMNPEVKIRMARIDQITEGAPVTRAVLKFLCK